MYMAVVDNLLASWLIVFLSLYIYIYIYMGHTVTQLVEALRYKPECRGFDSQWCHWNF